MEERANGKLTPVETLVMGCVWYLSAVTVRQVRQRLRPKQPLAYNAVLTVTRVPREKGSGQ